MENKGVTLTGGGIHAGTGAGSDEGAAGTTTRAARAAAAKSVTDYAQLAACASKLHQDGEQFVSNIVTEAARYDLELKVTKITGSNYEARVLTGKGMAYILIFHETFVRRDISRAPSVSVTRDVIEQMELLGITEPVIQVLVVFKDMYAKYENVAVGIINSFLASDGVSFKDLTIQDYDASGELHVSLNMKDALAFAETTTGSPLAHCDSAILIYSKTRKDKKNSSGYTTDDDIVMRPICAVTGYTDLKRVPADMFNSQYKYNPTFVITNIYSLVRTTDMAMFGITVAADVFIQRGMWLNAFSSFGEGDRNLGNLFVDPRTKKPFACKNIADRTMLMQQHFVSNVPYLAIDLQEGCDQFPGLKDLIANPDKIREAIRTFSGGNSSAGVDIIQGEAIQYDGIVDTNKGKIDTRAVDFLFLVDSKNGPGVAHERAATWLDYADPNDPRAVEKKALALEDFYRPEKIELGYTTHRVFFNPDFVTAVAQDLSTGIHPIIDSWVSNQVYDISGMKRFASNMAAMFSAGGGSTYSGFRGFAY